MTTPRTAPIEMETVPEEGVAGAHLQRPLHRPTVERSKSVKDTFRTWGRRMRDSTADFFGVGDEDCTGSEKWTNRRIRLQEKSHCGAGVKDDYIKRTMALDDVDFGSRNVYDPLHVGGYPTGGVTPGLTTAGTLPPTADDSMLSATGSVFSGTDGGTFRHPVRRNPSRRSKKDSVARLAYTGLTHIASVKRRQSQRKKDYIHSRSFAPTQVWGDLEEGGGTTAQPTPASVDDSLTDDVFFDTPTPTALRPKSAASGAPLRPFVMHPDQPAAASTPPAIGTPEKPPLDRGWRRTTPSASTVGDVPDGEGRNFIEGVFEKALEFDNSDRHEIGMGVMGRFFNVSFRKDRLDTAVRKQISELDDHRPYFTYWVTFVQVAIYIISVAVYGIAPIGFEETQVGSAVLKPSLVIEQVSYWEKDNFWIGPRQADLIHLGAKYSPCMRRDRNVVDAIGSDRKIENQTACCIRNDGSGCYQTGKSDCSSTLSTWKKFGSKRKDKRVSGSVCGQDPEFCKQPASSPPHEWKDDITKWPVCRVKSNTDKAGESYEHMTCEVSGHPCCIGIQGECTLTTREHCTFLRGYFHEEANLCSQVSCMSQICGMIPFLDPEKPDQFYRLWTSLFLHAGVIHLLTSVIFQIVVCRDVEKLAGSIRIAIIYLGSGLAGNLASAIFLPYQVEAGPAGSQFSILACLFVEQLQTWQMMKKPWLGILKLCGITLFLFILGLLPMVDNYSHLVGFLFGFLLSFALLPYVTFGEFDRKRKLIAVVVSLVTVVGLLTLLFILFYVAPIYDCTYCSYFNCIPFTPKFCKNMEVKIRRTEVS